MADIDIEQLRSGFRGKLFAELVVHHLVHAPTDDTSLMLAKRGYQDPFNDDLQQVSDDLCSQYLKEAHSEAFWQRDCCEVFDEICTTFETSGRAQGSHTTDQLKYNAFQIALLSLVALAREPDFLHPAIKDLVIQERRLLHLESDRTTHVASLMSRGVQMNRDPQQYSDEYRMAHGDGGLSPEADAEANCATYLSMLISAVALATAIYYDLEWKILLGMIGAGFAFQGLGNVCGLMLLKPGQEGKGWVRPVSGILMLFPIVGIALYVAGLFGLIIQGIRALF